MFHDLAGHIPYSEWDCVGTQDSNPKCYEATQGLSRETSEFIIQYSAISLVFQLSALSLPISISLVEREQKDCAAKVTTTSTRKKSTMDMRCQKLKKF